MFTESTTVYDVHDKCIGHTENDSENEIFTNCVAIA